MTEQQEMDILMDTLNEMILDGEVEVFCTKDGTVKYKLARKRKK